MRFSECFIPTLRDDPADAEAVSHKLIVRAGLARQLMSGVYSLLPLGQKVAAKIEAIVRAEMDRIGGQEFKLPALHPADLWRKSGRWDAIGDELFRLEDRHGTDVCLGMTHEEIFAFIARELRSYRQLPQIWYQIQTKFRDEARPKSGLLRVREFVMKDSYSFNVDREGLDCAFERHFEAYRKIFGRCGLDPLAVEASSGSMGGSESVEFMIPSEAGEDRIVSCSNCGYAANVERATSQLPIAVDPEGTFEVEEFATPGVGTIEDLAAFADGTPPDCQIKTLVYSIDERIFLVLLQGDHHLNEQKLADATDATNCRPAHPGEIRTALGADPGSLGAVRIDAVPVLADNALLGRHNMTTGANQDGYHLRGVDVKRDIQVTSWLDLREVKAGEGCPSCESPLDVEKAIEVGHIFKLGTRYSESIGAQVLDENGDPRALMMGSYGIGIGRTLAAVVEQCHDERGIHWPLNIAPFEVVVSVLDPKKDFTREAGENLYEAIRKRGVDTLLDDRDERPGVKFKDSELLGIPYRVTVGPKGLATGQVEIVARRPDMRRNVEVYQAAEIVADLVLEGRS